MLEASRHGSASFWLHCHSWLAGLRRAASFSRRRWFSGEPEARSFVLLYENMALSVSAPPTPLACQVPQLSVVPRREASGRPEIDLALLTRARSGEPAALESFVRHYQERVHAFLRRSFSDSSHAEDLTQEVFLRALRALPRFEPGSAKVSTWLFQIAVHLILDRKKKKREELVPVTMEVQDLQPSPEESYAERALLERLQAFVATLPEDQRIALILHEFHALSHAEIAEITHAPSATVKTRIFRARAALKKALLSARRKSR